MQKPKLFLLAIACLCTLINTHAATYKVQIGYLTYSVNTETLKATLTKADEYISGDLVIPASIEATPDGVTRTYAVTIIEKIAFKGCASLASITIPNSVTYIRHDAFRNCTSLTSIEVESENPNYASFDGILYGKDMTTLLECPRGKTAADIPNSVITIKNRAFLLCTSLVSVTIPNSVTTIEEAAFRVCTSLASVTIPNSVISIGAGAFGDCPSLTLVTIPESVTSIGEGAFAHCKDLTSIEVDGENPNYTSLDGILYNKDMTSLVECPGARTAVDIPNSVTAIEHSAFTGCFSLASVTIPNSVTSIKNYAFQDCSSLASVTIPESVTSIGYNAFSGCTNLEKIYCQWENPITCEKSVWDSATYSKATLYVPKHSIAAYQSTDPWSLFLNIAETSGIDPATAVGNEAKTIVGAYDISGKPVAPDTKGLVIVRYSDGSVAKVVNRDR